MKYLDTTISEQETTINVIYDEHIISVYSNRKEVVKNLTRLLGKPTKRDRKGKTYWTGATWDLDFNEFEKINKVLNRDCFIETTFNVERKKISKPKVRKEKVKKYEQYRLDI